MIVLKNLKEEIDLDTLWEKWVRVLKNYHQSISIAIPAFCFSNARNWTWFFENESPSANWDMLIETKASR